MKKIIALIATAALTFAAFAAPTIAADTELPRTSPTMLDDFEEGMFFKAITGLAKGVYAVKLIQLDSKQNTIFESDFNFFVIG